MEKRRPIGIYDLNIRFSGLYIASFIATGLPALYQVEEEDISAESNGICTVSFDEAAIHEVVDKLIEHQIEADIEIHPFFGGDVVTQNAYVRLEDCQAVAYMNSKVDEAIAFEMTKLLQDLERMGIFNANEKIRENIAKFHCIGWVTPLPEPV